MPSAWSSDTPLKHEDMTEADKLQLVQAALDIIDSYKAYLNLHFEPLSWSAYIIDPRLPQMSSGLCIVTRRGVPHQLLTPWGGLTFPRSGPQPKIVSHFLGNLETATLAVQIIRERPDIGTIYSISYDILAIATASDLTLPKAAFAEDHELQSLERASNEWDYLRKKLFTS